MKVFGGLLFLMLVLNGCVLCNNEDRDHWYKLAQSSIESRLKNIEAPLREIRARNVIVFVGDGMSLNTLTAARILSGQRRGFSGEEAQLVWDNYPTIALAKTYNADAQIGESSACATAMWCGVKANYETVGLDSSAKFGDCISSFSSRVPSVLTWAQEQGKATGIVTTTRISHATPAPLYSHSASRHWEDDGKVPPNYRRHCKDIVRQLVEDDPGRNINVLLGGGRRHWLSMNTNDPEHPYKEGRRLDGRNLIKEWIKNKEKSQQVAEYVWTKEQLKQIDSNKVDHLLGLFAYSHLDFEADRNETQPSLTDMTLKALDILSKNPWGYFLLVEGGRIDHAHHYNNAYRALDETLALEETVKSVMKEVDLSETLIIVTSDHSHVMAFGGYGTKKGNAILDIDTKTSDVDNIPYTTLLYTNGPGYANDRKPMVGKNAIQNAAVPRNWATHGGEDVPVFSTGPLHNLFSGLFDQTYLPHAISYVACLGPYHDRCGCPNVDCNKDMGTETENEPDNYLMVSDQDNIIADYMKMVNSVNRNSVFRFLSILNLMSIYLLF